MDIRAIQTFLRVVDLGSFTKAANEMNYVQSTVTMQIQQLERELGFPLFDRIGKKISLTSLGREFLSYANEILNLVQQAGTLGKDPKEVSGTLRVGILESLVFSTMIDILPSFKSQYKNVDVQLKMGQAADLLVLLKQNQLDLAYISGDLNTEPDLHCCYKRKENLIFVTGPCHEAAHRRRIPLEELFSHSFIVTERSGICYGRLREIAAAHSLTLHHSLVVDSTTAIAELLGRGVGTSFLPEYSVSKRLQNHELVRVDADIEPQIYYSQILYHKNKWIAPFVEDFLSLIRDLHPETEETEGTAV